MLWTLDLKPWGWGKSLTLPLTVEGVDTLRLTNDPASLPEDMLDEVIYMMQAAPRIKFELLTVDPHGCFEWMRSSEVRWALVQRLVSASWGVDVRSQELASVLLPWAIQWPVRNRWLRTPKPPLNLATWMPHPFSTIGHTGVCEDCEVGRAESIMHGTDAPTYFQRIEYV